MSHSIELDPVLVQPLRRPERRAPKRSRTAPPAVRPAVFQAAAAVIAAGLLFSCAGQIIAVASEPVVATYRTGREVQRLQLVLAQEQTTNAQLQADISYLGTRAGIEQEARRRGWVMPGEVALTLVSPHQEATSVASTEPAEPPAPALLADRVRSAVDTTLAVLGGRAGRPAE